MNVSKLITNSTIATPRPRSSDRRENRPSGTRRPGWTGDAASASATASCFYTGTIRHRRVEPTREFSHRLSLMYIDLDELPSLLRGSLVRRRPGVWRFRRRDFLGPAQTPLDVAVRDRVQELTGSRPDGPVRLLTQLRCFGVCFNPVSFYYCHDAGGELRAVLADVTNTPWGERHSYVLADVEPRSRMIRGTFAKQLHVSPFMSMDHVYRARATAPGESLSVHIESLSGSSVAFDATLRLQRRACNSAELARITARHPFASARVVALIYGHALGLKLAGAGYHPRPTAAP